MCIPAPHRLLFGRYPFQIHGVSCECFESFLQALKFKEENTRRFICRIRDDKDLKSIRDIAPDWRKEQLLYWDDKCFKRDSNEYQALISTAFGLLSLHPLFQHVLSLADYDSLSQMTRSNDKTQTVFTYEEALSRLLEARSRLNLFSENGYIIAPYDETSVH